MANLVMEFSEDEIQMISFIFNYIHDRQIEGSLNSPPYIVTENLNTLVEEARQSIDNWYRSAEADIEEDGDVEMEPQLAEVASPEWEGESRTYEL